LGIFIALVVVVALFAGGMILSRSMGGNFAPGVMPRAWNVPLPNNQNGWRHPMMGGFDRNDGRDFRRFGGFLPFGFGLMAIGGLLRLLVPLGILALGAYFFYWSGKKAGLKEAAPVVAAPAPQAEPTAIPESAEDEKPTE
jgi:hypothetical protein